MDCTAWIILLRNIPLRNIPLRIIPQGIIPQASDVYKRQSLDIEKAMKEFRKASLEASKK